jgi:hypothetical protein
LAQQRKSQITSTKLQTNHKFQYSMTKTFDIRRNSSCQGSKVVDFGCPLILLPFWTRTGQVWDFEFRSLEFI